MRRSALVTYQLNEDNLRAEIERDTRRSGSAATHFRGNLSDKRDVGDGQSVTFVTHVTLCPVAAEPLLQ